MLRRIGRCRKKVLGLLRLMGNKADVVKGLAKRCNENWRVAPTSDIVSVLIILHGGGSDHELCRDSIYPTYRFVIFTGVKKKLPTSPSRTPAGSPDYHDPKSEPLRENPVPLTFKLSSSDIHRYDGREQPDQRCPLEANCFGYRSHTDEPGHRYVLSILSIV